MKDEIQTEILQKFSNIKKLFYDISLSFWDADLTLSLNFASGLNEVFTFFKKLSDYSVKSSLKNIEIGEPFKKIKKVEFSKQEKNEESEISYLDVIRYSYHGKVQIKVKEKFKIIILTGIFPYELSYLQV